VIVLVVSNDRAVREEAQFGFPTEVTVRLAGDAREAMAVMEEGVVPAVVVVDMRTGSAGGFELSSAMHQLEELAEVPIVILLERDQDAWLARQAGAARYLTKPVDVGVFVDVALSVVEAPTK